MSSPEPSPSPVPRASTGRIPISGLLVYAGLLVGLIYLLLVQLSPAAAMHATAPPPGTALLHRIDNVIAKAAGDQPVELHLQASAQDWDNNAAFLSRIYFSAVYHQYPRPVLIGEGNAIINSPGQLQQADRVAPDAWLHQEGVASVVSLMPGDQDNWHALIHRVP